MSNPIIQSFKETVVSIKNHKRIVLLIFLIQILFFATFAINIVTMMTPVLKSSQDAMNYINQLKLDEQTLAESFITGEQILGVNPTSIYENYTVAMKFFKLFVTIGIIIFILFEGFNWILTVHLRKKKHPKLLLKSTLNFALITVGYAAIVGIIAFIAIGVVINSPTVPIILVIVSLLAIGVLSYFLLIAYSLVHNKSLLDVLKKSFIIGTYKFYLVLPMIVISSIIITLFSALLFWSAESHIFIAGAAFVLFISSFIFSRMIIVHLAHILEKELF